MINEKILQKARSLTAGFLKNRRLELGLSQKEVAEALGVKYQSYSRMESGKFYISTKYLFALCEVLDLYFFLEAKESDSESANMMKYRFTDGKPPSKN